MSAVQPPPRLDVARLGTPVSLLPRLSEAWGGPKIWIKRDDQTGALLSGNKIRKLQYAVAEAREQGADTLITCGGLQSNHCRATAGIARQQGMDVSLLLRGARPDRLEGNYLLDRVLGAKIKFCTTQQYAARGALMDSMAAELRRGGKTPYVIAEGCSMPIGCWGYIEAAEEIAAAQREHEVEFDAIVHALGSGGTTAGLELGARMHGLGGTVMAMAVCDDAPTHRRKVHALMAATADRWHLDVEHDAEELNILDAYVGRGYGITQPEEIETLSTVARLEGIILDPAYTGKAMHGLRREIERGDLGQAANVLFVHTGGIFGTMAYGDVVPV